MSSMGMKLLLKQFGIDPELIEAKFEEAKNLLNGTIMNFDARLVAIEKGQELILAKLEEIRLERYTGQLPAGIGTATGPDAFERSDANGSDGAAGQHVNDASGNGGISADRGGI